MKILHTKGLGQFLAEFFVGLGATIVEWVVFALLTNTIALHYAPATAIAFILSTFANWALGRLLTFKDTDVPLLKELLSIYLASVVGLLFNLALMYLFVDRLAIPEMISKMLATCIVFFWNFFIRKLVIYRRKTN